MIMRLLLLAVRNLLRNRRRTAITGLAVGFGAFAVVVLQSLVNGLVGNIVETSVLARVGAVQVFRTGYLGSDDPLKKSFADDPLLVARLAAVPGVVAVAPRLDFDGMLSNGSEATMFMATAIDPSAEYRVCPLRATLVAKGSRPLAAGDDRGALLGKTLAEALGARETSTLVMQAAGAHAGTNALDVSVQGFLPSYHPMASKRLATVPLAFAQELLRMPGQVTEYVIGVSDLGRVEEVAAAVRSIVGSDHQVTTWRELDPATRDRARMIRYVLFFVALVLALLVATGIVNTTMMSVHERVREIGTMLAVGLRRWQVTALFLFEAIALGLASGTGGASASYALVRLLARNGVQGHAPGGDPLTYYPGVGVSFLAAVVAFTVVEAALAAVYPAWRAARLRPVEALRAT